jgi:GT2 family glycosyltransferase/glycosyltransferase involved in cell wall biosynthesis
MTDSPRVSVILVNYKGVDDTLSALDALMGLPEYPDTLEIVVVDNASGDGSVEALRARDKDIVVVASPTNSGFAGGCNLGVKNSSGEIVAFLNNDAKPERQWVSAALESFDTYDNVGAVASQVLNWDGTHVDFSGAGMTWYGMGYRPLTGSKVRKKPQHPVPVLFGTGAAMFVRRDVFDALGGFDESFFMFFEDVDFGWRLNLAGYTYLYQPQSIAFHRYHGSMGGIPQHREQFLLERNALYCLYKNLDEAQLQRILPGALLASVKRAVVDSGVDTTQFDLSRGSTSAQSTEVPSDALAPLFAMDQFVNALPEMMAKRADIQRTRQRSDAAIWRLFGETNAAMSTDARYLRGYDAIVEAFGVTNDPPALNVLIVTGDPIGKKLSGPGIRAWHMAEALSASHDVTIVSLTGVDEALSSAFRLTHVEPGDDATFSGWESWADTIIFQGHALDLFPSLRASSKHLIVDIYDPLHLEQLEQARHLPVDQWERQVSDARATIESQLAAGDYFLCASERQRHFYLGQLTTLGRVSPSGYADDPHLERLIGVVPFGLPGTDPRHTRPVLKGVLPGIGAEDHVIIWSGGVYDWFDPLTLIRAVAQLSFTRPTVKLFFMGTAHPHPGVPEMPVVKASRDLAEELGVSGKHVFFNDSWVDYDDRQNYLLEADLGVSTHRSHIETTFSFRTRILDYLWASLPMVVTDGDHFADEVDRHGLGKTVAAGDVGALAEALDTALFDDKFRARATKALRVVRENYRWDTVLRPLVNHVAGIAEGSITKSTSTPVRYSPARPRPPRFSVHDIGRGLQRLARGEFRSLVRAVLRKLRPLRS